MEIIAGNIHADFDGDLTIYLRASQDLYDLETGLKQLIINQFDPLQLLDLDAYQLLCRAGYYRYQDLARVDAEALLALLWDIEPAQRMKVVNALKNCSLIEFHRGQYWLHPAIRAECISRLRHTDWIQAHQRAAEYWSGVAKIIDISTAITALEAHYHYLEIGDFTRAARVLLQPRDNQWEQFLPLASNLYRMGLIQPVLLAVTQILPCLPPRITAELSNIFGDLYWIIGRVHEAIEAQQSTIEYTTKALLQTDKLDRHNAHCPNILNIDSLLSLVLYNIDLWELLEAQNLFEKVIEIASNTAHYR